MRSLIRLRCIAAITVLSLLTLSAIAAQAAPTPGSLDINFGVGGKVTTGIISSSSQDYGQAVAIQPDGKIVVAGNSDFGPSADFALARFNTDGSLDTSFNSTGKLLTDFGNGSSDFALGVGIQSGGKIVAGGYSFNNGYNFALARYNADGSLDTSFGEGGKFTHDLAGVDDAGADLAIQPNGRIVMAGYCYDGSFTDFAVVRYQTDMRARSDFDGDNRSDIAVWNPNNHNWYVRQSKSNTNLVQVDWGSGALGDIAVPRDYDGDGKVDFAVFRPSEGNWYILQSSNHAIRTQGWGYLLGYSGPGGLRWRRQVRHSRLSSLGGQLVHSAQFD